ncbi:hypothetical protein Esti_000964 [Eimeria stiedai]
MVLVHVKQVSPRRSRFNILPTRKPSRRSSPFLLLIIRDDCIEETVYPFHLVFVQVVFSNSISRSSSRFYQKRERRIPFFPQDLKTLQVKLNSTVAAREKADRLLAEKKKKPNDLRTQCRKYEEEIDIVYGGDSEDEEEDSDDGGEDFI